MTGHSNVVGKRFAAVDCGTNSIRLLVAEVGKDGEPIELDSDNVIVRLGQGVDATGKFAEEALARVDETLGDFTNRMVKLDVEDVKMGATSATRDASNKDVFFDMTAKHLGRIRDGAVAEVITGEQEAELSFAGAIHDLKLDGSQRVCVIDIGGGSTEFVVHDVTADGAVAAAEEVEAYSTNMGSVRLTERYLKTDPPTEAEIAAAEDFVRQQVALAEEHVDLSAVTKVVGVAGTITTTTAITKGLDSYQSDKIHMTTLTMEEFRDMALKIRGETVEKRREYGPMHPYRADVMGGGATIIDVVTRRFEELGIDTITISEKDILNGMLGEVIARNF